MANSRFRAKADVMLFFMKSPYVRLACLAVTVMSVSANAAWAGDDDEGPGYWAEKADDRFRVIGYKAGGCNPCHEVGRKDYDGWMLLNEYVTWQKHDVHQHAYRVLLNEQSQAIAKRMNIVEDGVSVVHRDKRCLACHSSVPVAELPSQDQTSFLIPAKVRRKKDDEDEVEIETVFPLKQGVSCEACHGPADSPKIDARWGQVHQKEDDWRDFTPQEKYEKFGFWDIRSPRTQTRICLSCHLGNVDQEKVLTHEMYAAGHPPLPSFELSQFVRQMPRHWRRFDEKPPELREKLLRKHKVWKRPAPNSISRTVSFASLVTLEESLSYSVKLMETSRWPELANYSCYGCHHELKRDSWRQKRTGKLRSLPTLQEWPFVASKPVIHFLEQDETFDELRGEIDRVLRSRPYGDATELQPALTAMAKQARIWSLQLEKQTIEDTDRHALLEFLVTVGADPDSIGFDEARQLLWMYERIYADLAKNAADKEYDKEHLHLKSWLGEASDQEPPQIVLDGVKDRLRLWLRDRTPAQAEASQAPDELPESKVDFVALFRSISDYDPEIVRETFKKLRFKSNAKADN